ncbi:MAG: hypothetical protein ACXAC7_16075 [Candidatus Hodarchaeales archaeon]|jgi:hypothetical protein
MGKDELQKLNEISDLLTNMQSQINFLQVQVASGGGRSSGGSTSPASKVGGGTIDPKQLQALEQRLEELLEVSARNTEALYSLRDELTRLVSGKIEAADERMNQVTRLLEQGLQFTEMGTHLTEVKDRLEEVIVELAAATKIDTSAPS